MLIRRTITLTMTVIITLTFTITRVISDMFINNDTRVFRFKMTPFSLSSFNTSNAAHCEPIWSSTPRIGCGGSLWRWSRIPEPNPKLLSAWPMPRLVRWVQRINEPLDQREFAAVQRSTQRGCPFVEEGWVETIARRLNLESTMRPRDRQKIQVDQQEQSKVA